MSGKAALFRCSFPLLGGLFTNFLYLLKLQSKLRAKCEPRIQTNKTKQNKTNKKQTNCRLQASICYFFLYVILLECLFVFSLLYWFLWDLMILMQIYSWVRNLTDYLPFKRGENSFSLWLCLSKKWWFTLKVMCWWIFNLKKRYNTRKLMNERGSGPSVFMVLECLETLMKHEARVYRMASPKGLIDYQ